jgi:hypothetical protein
MKGFFLFFIWALTLNAQLWIRGVETTFGRIDARPFGIYEYNSYIFIGGYMYYENFIDPTTEGFVACFDSTLTLKWVYATPESKTVVRVSTAAPLSNGGILAALRYDFNTTLLLIDKTGTLLKEIPFEGTTLSVGRAGEKIIGVTGGYAGTVYVMNEEGEILTQWKTNYVNGPKVSIQFHDGSLWLSSYSSVGTYVAKHKFDTGELLWYRVIPNGILGYSDIDSAGNCYFGSVLLIENPSPPEGYAIAEKYHMEKIDSDGNILWQTEWFGRENWIARVVAGVGAVSVNSAKNLVTIGGEIQKDEGIPDGGRAAYVAGLSMDNGKIAWEMKWHYGNSSYSSDNVSSVYGICSNKKGEMFVTGYEWNGYKDLHQLPSYAHIDEYRLEKIVDVTESNSIPTSYSLSQNYPNPFNPTTTISFSIPICVTSDVPHVSLKIYDVLGREVATLVDEEKPAGNYEILFDGSNLTSGIYFYTLKAEGFSETKKMLLIK